MQPLDDSKIRNLLHTLEDLVKSSVGPSGRLLFFSHCICVLKVNYLVFLPEFFSSNASDLPLNIYLARLS